MMPPDKDKEKKGETDPKEGFLNPEKYLEGLEDYLARNEVYEIFDFLMKEVVVTRPLDPCHHMVSLLQHITGTHKNKIDRVCVIGPSPRDTEHWASRIADETEMDLLKTATIQDRADIIPALKKKATKGFIVSGYPNTPQEAWELVNRSGILITLVVIIYVPNFDEVDFRRLLETFDEEKKVVFCPHQGGEDEEDELEFITSRINTRAISKQLLLNNLKPLSPPRIIILSGRGGGSTTQGELLAKSFGLVFVDAHRVGAQKGTRASTLHQRVVTRLEMEDCRLKGFVLAHYPAIESEVELFSTYLHSKPGPFHLIQLECPPSDALEHLTDRAAKIKKKVTPSMVRDINANHDEHHHVLLKVQELFPKNDLHVVYGNRPIDDIRADLRTLVDDLL